MVVQQGEVENDSLPTTTPPTMPSPPPLTPFQQLLQYDKDVSYLIYRAYNTNFSRLPLLVLEVSGHGVPWIVAPILIFLFKRDLSPEASSLMLNFLAVTAVDLITIGILKPVFRRKRPAYNTGIGHVTIYAVDQFSFPSGHATRVAFVAAFLSYARHTYPAALHPLIASTPFTLSVYIWAAAVCASRVALGRHHVLDVVAGAIIGATYTIAWTPFWLSAKISDRFRRFFQNLILGSAKMALVGTASSPVLNSD